MLGVLDRFVGRMALTRLGAILCGLTALVILVDFLDDGDQVLADGGQPALQILRYVLLRLPDTLSQMIPVAALLAGVLTFAELARQRELAVLFLAGVSRLRLAASLLPVAVVLGAVQFVIDDRAVPLATQELRHWGIGEYETPDPDRFNWMRVGNDMVQYRLGPGQPPTLLQVELYRRDSEGTLLEVVRAATASFEQQGWRLHDVIRTGKDRRGTQATAEMLWAEGPQPSLVADISQPPEGRPFTELVSIVEHSGLGDYPPYVYELQLHERLMRPILTILLMLVGAALARPMPRRRTIGLFIAAGALLGLIWWLFGEVTTQIAGLGLLPPVLAAWAPVILAVLVLWSGSIARSVREPAPVSGSSAG